MRIQHVKCPNCGEGNAEVNHLACAMPIRFCPDCGQVCEVEIDSDSGHGMIVYTLHLALAPTCIKLESSIGTGI